MGTCCSTSWPGGCRSSASSRRRTSPGRRPSGECRPWSSSSVRSSRGGSPQEGRRADLIAANNVLAQVPDLNDFVAGLAILLADEGVLTVEVPHLMRLIEENQFDTIYHEHFSYFSFRTACEVFAAHELARLRRGRAPDPRRVAPALRVPPRQQPRDERERGRTVRARGRRGLSHARALRRFPCRRPGDEACTARVPDPREARRSLGRRLRRSRQGQHAPQLLRHPRRLPRLHGRPESLQAGPLSCRVHISRSSTRTHSRSAGRSTS